VDADEIVELRLDPIDREKSPRFDIGPRPLYHIMLFAAWAAAAAPAAAVNLPVHASSTPSATAKGSSSSYLTASSTGSFGPFMDFNSSRSATLM
jgi:hypothetical protein